MKNIFFFCLCALFAFTGCTDDEEELLGGGNPNIDLLPPPLPNNVINEKLFEVINLDYPGLEKVKEYYEADNYYHAAYELLKYYRNRLDINNPNINLINPSITAFDQNVADQALEYKFYVRNFKESEVNGKEVYYLFYKDKKIDWSYIPAEITDQEFKSQLHRHQWMLPQAKAYRVNRNEKYVQSWISVYSDWLKTFPCPEGTVGQDAVQWHGLQPTERVLSQIDMMPYFIQSVNFTPEWLSTFLTAFSDEVECIRNNYYTDGSNIYVTQVQAVTTAGILMPEFKNSAAWLNEGTQKLTVQISEQFLEDGVQNELDPSYHIGVVAGFYNIYQIAQVNNKLALFPSDYIEKLRKATRFVMDIIYPDYTIDNFNDTRSASYTKGVLLKNLKQYSDMFPEDQEMKWIATEGKQGQVPTELTQKYAASGYYMLRSAWGKNATMMILKNNNNVGNKWHCQPDNGTFGLYRNGRNFFPDAGVYSYGGTSSSNAERNQFLATKNHNTMTVFNATLANGFMNGEYLNATVQGNAQLIVTQNQSYTNLTHRRAVFFVNKEFFVLVDEGYGDGNKDKINLNFHLCTSETDATVYDDLSASYQYGAHTTFTDNNNMLIRTFAETSANFEKSDIASDVSNKLGEKNATRKGYQYTIRKPENGAARFITVIYPFGAASEAASVTIDARFTDNATEDPGTFHANGAAVEVTIKGVKYDLSYIL